MKTHRVIIESHPTLLGGNAYRARCECAWESNWFDAERVAKGFADQHLRTATASAKRAELKRRETA